MATRITNQTLLGLDVAACAQSTLVPDNWIGPTHPDPARRDALAYDNWAEMCPSGAVWMNPPYAVPVLRQFLHRGVNTARAGVPVMALVPASTGASWWHTYVTDGEVEFLQGRLVYEGPHFTGWQAPWPSAIVTWAA